MMGKMEEEKNNKKKTKIIVTIIFVECLIENNSKIKTHCKVIFMGC
jgi:hypothetical protein